MTLCVAMLLAVPSTAAVRTKGETATPCGLCRFFVGYVEDLVGQNKTVAEITTALSALCSLAPGEMRGACQGFVSYYVPFMVAYLIDTNNPGKSILNIARIN